MAARVAHAAGRPGAVRALLLDLDGTLAPIAPTPEAARVPGETRTALRTLTEMGWRVAVISGRPAAQARRMLPVTGLLIFGSHGLEGSWDGRPSTQVRPALARRLSLLARRGRALAARTEGARLERKPAGLAFHDRRVPARMLKGWRDGLRTWLERQDLRGLEILHGKRVLEIRPRGVHKGVVARPLLAEMTGRQRDESLVALGDDRTDEDLFREVSDRGLTVRVGAPGVRTAASLRIASPKSVQQFLHKLSRLETERLPKR